MQLNEIDLLTIGSYLQDREGRLCVVDELSKKEFSAPAVRGAITAPPCQPIKLDENWMDVVCLDKVGENWLNEFILLKPVKESFEVYVYSQTDLLEPVPMFATVEYLHEVQYILKYLRRTPKIKIEPKG